MSLLAAILHQRNDLLGESITVDGIYDLAVVADKYDCAFAIKHTSTMFFSLLSDIHAENAPFEMTEAAYRLDHHQAFARLTSVLVRRGFASTLKDATIPSPSPLRGIYGTFASPIVVKKV